MAANMNALPDEILYYICDYLETIDKIRLASVCQRLRKVLSSPLLNRKASFKHCWHVPYKAIQQYIGKNKEWIQKLELQDCYWLKQTQLVRSIKKCTNLVSLDVSGCSVSQNNVMEIMGKCSNLKHFGWSVDKKIFNAVEYLLLSDNAPGQVKQLNSCFKKLSSIKLVLYKEKNEIELLDVHLMKQLKICKFLLSDLCLKRLQLNLFEEGYNVSHPFDIAIETDNGIEILKGQRCHPAVFIKCFPLNNSTTANLSFSTTFGIIECVYWEDKLLDDILHLRNIDFSGTIIMKISKENICKLLSCPSLEFIKIGKEPHSSKELLSICSPVLESINLENSTHSLDSDFLVLENLLEKCPRLKHINLLRTHKSWHCTSDHSKDFIKTLSSFKSLVSLAINPCCIRANASEENSSHQNCNKADNSLTLAALVESCTRMTEFELIDSKFRSDITKHERCFRPFRVPSDGVITLSLDTLTCLSKWKHLQKLTLAGFQVNRADFFITICKECTELKSLSIAHLKGPALSHSGNVTYLNKALTHCHNLRDLRLEQPHFDITKHFLNALHNAEKLERVCLMVNHGKLAVKEIEPWLNKCSKVIFVQMFCDLTLTLCKTLKEQLESKYGPHRPAFTASFFAFHGDITSTQIIGPKSPRKITPLVHLQEMTMFRSRVANSYRLGDEF